MEVEIGSLIGSDILRAPGVHSRLVKFEGTSKMKGMVWGQCEASLANGCGVHVQGDPGGLDALDALEHLLYRSMDRHGSQSQN